MAQKPDHRHSSRRANPCPPHNDAIMWIQIITHTPLWVWGLLTALLALGLWQRRERRVRPFQLLLLPAMLMALGLWSMAPGFVALPVCALIWALAVAASSWLGLQLPRPRAARWLADAGQLQLPGSWVPMVIIISIFGMRYATGVSLAFNPHWRNLASVQWPLALTFGLLSGLFLGRALGLYQLTRALPVQATTVGDAQAAH